MIKFWKAHAYGNDFLYVERASLVEAEAGELAREMCNRHTGIGADGLIVFERTQGGAVMRLFNSDGGRAEVSGNGVRGLAALLGRDDPADPLELLIVTEGGAKAVARTGRSGTFQTFRASMGQPTGLRRQSIAVAGETLSGIVLNMGNPQLVLLGPLPEDGRFARLGAALERHEMFPERTNVEFAFVESPSRVRIRIWERGAGPTTSSGTGSCAALVAAAAFGGASRQAEVIAPGGAQLVEWREDGVYLTGDAEVLCAGEWLRPVKSG